MPITFEDFQIDRGERDITPEQEREIEAREECEYRGLDPDEICADGGVTAWMVVAKESEREVTERMLDALAEAQRAQLALAEHHRILADQHGNDGNRTEAGHHSFQSEKFRHAAHCIRMCMEHQQSIVDRAERRD